MDNLDNYEEFRWPADAEFDDKELREDFNMNNLQEESDGK